MAMVGDFRGNMESGVSTGAAAARLTAALRRSATLAANSASFWPSPTPTGCSAATAGGFRAKMKSGAKIGAATARPMTAPSPAAVASAARKPKRSRFRAGSAASAAGAATATASTPAVATGGCACQSAKAARPDRHLPVEQVAAAGNQLDQLALVVAKRGADFADALEKAVVADMDVRPNRVDQVLLAENASGVGHKQLQHVEGFRAQPDRFATGPAEPGAFRVKFKSGETEQLVSAIFSGLGCAQRISEKFQKVTAVPSGPGYPTVA